MAERLTKKQEAFAKAYVTAGSGAEAARIAGYSPKVDKVVASRNITKDNVIERIRELSEPKNAEEEARKVQITEKLARLGLEDEALKDSDKLRALELLAKRYGMFIERTEVGFVDEKKKVLAAVEGLVADLFELIPDERKAEAGEIIGHRLSGLDS